MATSKPEFCDDCGARVEKLTKVDAGVNAYCEECLDKLLESKALFECVECHQFFSDECERSEYEDDAMCVSCYDSLDNTTEELWAGYYEGLR